MHSTKCDCHKKHTIGLMPCTAQSVMVTRGRDVHMLLSQGSFHVGVGHGPIGSIDKHSRHQYIGAVLGKYPDVHQYISAVLGKYPDVHQYISAVLGKCPEMYMECTIVIVTTRGLLGPRLFRV
jgi:hypothetical protein